MDSKHYYHILGVSKDASQNQINHAYRELAKKYHPDINHAPGAGKKFTKINQAYSVLGNKHKRAQYDAENSTDDSFGGFSDGFSSFGNQNNQSQNGFSDDFSDIFNSFFNGDNTSHRTKERQKAERTPHRGKNMAYHMRINFAQAVFGDKTTISYYRTIICPACHGNGAEPGTSPSICPMCHGTGVVTSTSRTPIGMVENKRTCPKCHGKGQIIKIKCRKCSGSGRVTQNHKLVVDIPAGIDDGERLRLAEQGEAGVNGGGYGDLYISFSVTPSKYFTKDGDDLVITRPISLGTAILGGKIQVRSLNREEKNENGKQTLKIPHGTQTGSTFYLRGLGIPSLSSHTCGDEEVKVNVVIPQSLNHQQKKAIQAFVNASGNYKRKGKKNNSIFSRMKRAFNRK